MSDRAPYSRVYWSVMDDEKFDGVREDVRHLGSWTLLLIVADMAWPAPAFVPSTVPKASFRVLTEAGLIDTLSGGRFRVHGLDAERGRRADAARTGPKRDPNASQTGPKRSLARGSLDETRRDEDETRTRQDEQPARDGLPNLTKDAIKALESRTGRIWSQAGERQLSEYDRLIGDHGLVKVCAAMDAAANGVEHPTARQLVWAAMKILEPMIDTRVTVEEGIAEDRQAGADRSWQRRIEHTKLIGHDNGAHIQPDPGCPACSQKASA